MTNSPDPQLAMYINSGREAVKIESQAVAALLDRIDTDFAKACSLVLACKGRVIVSGIGKSGHIAKKIAATLASTGTPAFFVHPSEASHGDLGMITRDDLIITISNSGATNELVTLVPMFKRLGNTIISMSGNKKSQLAEFADVNLDVSVKEEACPLKLAPTSSTTVALVMGDALAIALLEARGFSSEDFAFSHPGGALGRKLLLRTRDIMHKDQELPKTLENALLSDALNEMTSKGFGMTTIVDGDNALLGIFTDGDLRRCIHKKVDLNTAGIRDVMNATPKTVHADLLAAEALLVMEQSKITALVVNDDNNNPIGVLHMHDLLRAGIY